jgi:multicomponent Na+:H+ antiporter subunit B
MTSSILLKFVARVMMPVLLLFSLFLLLRGHNQPGGGFVGGLVGAGSIVLMTLAYGPDVVRRRLRVDFLRSMIYGVMVAAISGIFGLIFAAAFQDSFWFKPIIQGIGRLELGTPLLFDVGVYIAVLSVTSIMVMAMAEEGEIED